MRIGISVIMAGRSAGGPETYEIQLLRALAAIDRENEYIVYTTTPAAQSAIGVEQSNFHYRLLKPGSRIVSLSLTLPYLLARDRVDLYHATFTPPPFSTRPLVFTVHCLSSMVHPEIYEPLTAMRLNFLLKRGILNARQLLCVSDTTRKHVNEKFGIPIEDMRVTYNGVSGRLSPSPDPGATAAALREAGIPSQYILYLGKIQKHKNVGRLLEAYQQYRNRSANPLPLVLAGREQGTVEPISAIADRLGLTPHIYRLGYVPDALVPELYRGAHAFVFPSLWEGFGIPLVEAMASGAPVITSSATSLPEVAANAALVVDPHNATAIADALMRIEAEPGLRDSLIARGFRRAADFSWAHCAEATLDAYYSVGQGSRSGKTVMQHSNLIQQGRS